MPNPAIEFRNVSKSYRSWRSDDSITALSGFSFRVEAGEVCGFLGPNGAGKTTAISLLMGFLAADSGEIDVLGYPAGDVRSRQQIGFLPENFAFYGYLTAPGLLQLHFALSGIRHPAPGAIPDLLRKVKLNGYENLRISRFSRGMAQRAGIAQALLADPQLLVLDEPTSGLDPASRHDVLELIGALKTEGKTIFLSSHILPEVESIADRIVVIDRGRLVHAGSLPDLLDTGNRAEILVDDLSDAAEQMVAERGAEIERLAGGQPCRARIVFDAARKREMAELLWSLGCEVSSMNPLKTSLEGLFLKLVSDYEEQK
jgi:ABC-2 type transport system ATP-binding protein